MYNFILAQLIETSHGLLFGLYGGADFSLSQKVINSLKQL